MGLYGVPLSVSLLGFGIGTMLANFHVWGIMFFLRPVLNILVRNASPMFVLCVVCLTVFVNCLVKQFAICLFAILLLKVMNLFSIAGGAPLDRPGMVFQRMCVLCLWSQWASRCSFHTFCLCFCMSEVISSFRSLRVISMMFVKFLLAVCILVGIVVWAKADSVSYYGYISVNMSIFLIDDVTTQQWYLLDVNQLNDTVKYLKRSDCNQQSLCKDAVSEPWRLLYTITSL